MKIRPEEDLTLDDWRLIHTHRNVRAQLRRKRTGTKLRGELEALLPELEAEAKSRGITAWLPGWRSYPARSADGVHGYRLGVTFAPDGEMRIDSVPPSQVERLKPRKDKPFTGGELVDALLAELERMAQQ